MPASVAEQASLSLTSSEPPEDTFSHDEAQMIAIWTCRQLTILILIKIIYNLKKKKKKKKKIRASFGFETWEHHWIGLEARSSCGSVRTYFFSTWWLFVFFS